MAERRQSGGAEGAEEAEARGSREGARVTWRACAPLLGQPLQDRVERGLEAHVEQPVRLPHEAEAQHSACQGAHSHARGAGGRLLAGRGARGGGCGAAGCHEISQRLRDFFGVLMPRGQVNRKLPKVRSSLARASRRGGARDLVTDLLHANRSLHALIRACVHTDSAIDKESL